MFSPIECRLRPSRLALGVVFLPPVTLAVAAWMAGVPPFWLLPLLGVVLVTLWRLRIGRDSWHSLSWHGARLMLYPDASASADLFDWRGRGRRNAWYLCLRLHGDAGRYDLMLWRDAVSDASWRALNACYRVQEAALASEETNAEPP